MIRDYCTVVATVILTPFLTAPLYSYSYRTVTLFGKSETYRTVLYGKSTLSISSQQSAAYGMHTVYRHQQQRGGPGGETITVRYGTVELTKISPPATLRAHPAIRSSMHHALKLDSTGTSTYQYGY